MTDSADETATWASPHPPPAAPAQGEPPRVLSGRYRLEERIASGGMATVWRGWDQVLARTVAIKVLHEHLAADEAFRERFRREAISAARLTHPNVVSLYDTGRDGEVTYLVMEHVEGITLKHRLAAGALPVGSACRIGVAVARALDYAHQRGLIHRDVKPANILLGPDGAVKVTDFGIAKADQADDLTRTGTMLGTAAYVAPEQIRGDAVTAMSDQYALGVVLYEALTGVQPFRADTPLATAAQRLEHDPEPLRRLDRTIPRGVERAVQRALSREPQQRFASLAALAEALHPHTEPDDEEGERGDAAPSPDAPPAEPERADADPQEEDAGQPRPRPWRRALLAGGAGLVLLMAAVGGYVAATDEPFTGPLAPGEPEVETLDPEAIRLAVFDPEGEADPDDEGLESLLDGDEDTSWRTDHFDSADLGEGDPGGVGILIDLGEPMWLESVHLEPVLEPVDVQLRTADQPAAEAEEWTPVAAVDGGTESIALEPPSEIPNQHFMVWITGELPPSPYSSGRFTAEFSELEVRARPAS